MAVVAATRVTMPYGNAVFGCELLRACFGDHPATLGDLWKLAQQRTLAASPDDPLRKSLDALAGGLSPPPVDLRGRTSRTRSDVSAIRRSTASTAISA